MVDLNSDRNEESIEIFGTPVYFVDGLVRLRDIQLAYLNVEENASERATNPGEWWKQEGTKELVEYLENEDEVYIRGSAYIKVHDKPLGNRGGRFVCKELAHSYAMKLDQRYAVAVLRSFDELVSGKMFSAVKTAQSVARRMLVEDWNDRKRRIRSAGWDVEETLLYMMSNITASFTKDSMLTFVNTISNYPEHQTYFLRCMDTLETALFLTEDPIKSVEFMHSKHEDDPLRKSFEFFLIEWDNNYG